MKRAILGTCLASLLWFAPHGLAGEATGFIERVLVLKPKQVHEEAVALAGNQRAAYYVRSSAPLQFNIHYHEGESVTYLREDGPTGAVEDTLTAAAKRDYWFMWTNDSAEPVALYFKIRRQQKRL
jgi:hypothetical protein